MTRRRPVLRFEIGISQRVRRFLRFFDHFRGLRSPRRVWKTDPRVLVHLALVSAVDDALYQRGVVIIRMRFGPWEFPVRRVVEIVFDVRRVQYPRPVSGHDVHGDFLHVVMVHVFGVLGNVYFDPTKTHTYVTTIVLLRLTRIKRVCRRERGVCRVTRFDHGLGAISRRNFISDKTRTTWGLGKRAIAITNGQV